jgi:hypothetical protein
MMMPADGANQLRKFDAILFGAVGALPPLRDPAWHDVPTSRRGSKWQSASPLS